MGLFATVLAIATSTGAVLFSLKYTKSAQLALNAATAEHMAFEGKLRQVRNEENEIKQKAAMFNELQERGIIGEERRLDWVELIKKIIDERRLIDPQFEISPQRALDDKPGSSFTFYTSTMKLQLKLLHEEDLTRLLDDLRNQASALIQVKRCNISRLPPHTSDGNNLASPNGAHLQADCQIDWITAREVAGK